jgi:cytochrome c1/predicted small secreted protein
MKLRRPPLVALAVPVLLGGVVYSARPPEAQACGFAISVQRSAQPSPAQQRAAPEDLMLTAERLLDEGANTGAVLAAIQAFPGVRRRDPLRASALQIRALRTIAVATVRRDGAAPLGGREWESRQRNLEWAIETLAALHGREPSEVALLTDLGEALTHVPSREDEGREILEQLAGDDLLVHAQGYAALARQRAAAGDVDGYRAAAGRCEAMAGREGACPAPAAVLATGGAPGPRSASLAMASPAPSLRERPSPLQRFLMELMLLVALPAALAGCNARRGAGGDDGRGAEAGGAGGERGAARASEVSLAGADAARGKLLMQAFECNRCHDGTGVLPVAEEKHCVHCHQSIIKGSYRAPAATLENWNQRIVHLREVPSLETAGRRLRRGWVASFVREPHDLRPLLPESMPRLAISPEDARDIAAHLVPGEAAGDDFLRGDAAEGRRLLDAKGCGTCHRMTGVAPLHAGSLPAGLGPEKLARGMRLAPDLTFVRERFQTGTLVPWLLDPASISPDTPMPRVPLTLAEARSIARYLMTAPLAPPERREVPARLPLLQREVTYAEVSRRVLRNTCWHCHAEPGYALGDGGPGNSGGLGFAPRGLNLAEYTGVSSGYRGDDGKRHSVFAPTADGTPMLVASLLARQQEEAGRPVAGIRGMPLGLPSASPEDIQLVETWIAQGRKR